MPALLDQRLIKALQQQNIPYAVIVHDAQPHPGDLLSFRLLDQERLLRGASCLITLSSHVAGELHAQNYGQNGQKIIKLWHPPFSFGAMAPPLAHGGAPRVLFFGRLLPYKGLDLLADALSLLGAARPFIVKICGEGPATPELDRLRNLPNVTVDQRWIPESELPALLAWSDALVLPYREASQSGVAAAALAQGRYVLATNVGGLREQLEGQARAHLVEPNAAAIAAGLTGLFAPAHHTQTVDLTGDWLSMAAQMTASLERMT
ncbi:MAG TPA: glycosyltransferase [Acidiphilium sp.]|nr:glycosyltransferase [Acidiphilium sp.]